MQRPFRTPVLLGITLSLVLGLVVPVAAAPPVSVSISPTSVTLLANGTQQFTATVIGSSNTAVTWSTSGGTVSTTGLYTAPTTTGTYKVKAASVADATKSASATVTVTVPVSVSISPSSASLLTGSTQQFTATVTGPSNTKISWSTTGGTVSTSGLYTAPKTAGTYTVTATSAADKTSSASATVAVTAPVVSVSISPTSAWLLTGSTQQFTATVTGSSNTAVAWSATGGTVSFSGLYTAPTTTGSYTVTATSQADTTKLASAIANVSAPIQHTVNLTWTEDTSEVVGYNVYRGAASGGPYTQINTVLDVETNYVDNTVQSGQTYYYVTTAVSTAGVESVCSNEAAAAIPLP